MVSCRSGKQYVLQKFVHDVYENLQLRDVLHGATQWNNVGVNMNRTDVGEEIFDLSIEKCTEYTIHRLTE